MAKDTITVASLFGIYPEMYQYQQKQADLDYVTQAEPSSGLDRLFMLAGRRAGRSFVS